MLKFFKIALLSAIFLLLGSLLWIYFFYGIQVEDLKNYCGGIYDKQENQYGNSFILDGLAISSEHLFDFGVENLVSMYVLKQKKIKKIDFVKKNGDYVFLYFGEKSLSDKIKILLFDKLFKKNIVVGNGENLKVCIEENGKKKLKNVRFLNKEKNLKLVNLIFEKGDSGAPVFKKILGKYFLVGLVEGVLKNGSKTFGIVK